MTHHISVMTFSLYTLSLSSLWWRTPVDHHHLRPSTTTTIIIGVQPHRSRRLEIRLAEV
ncbi:hypothetical protein M6B38_261835 [Iris pallida]|uniref:Uncharacterized protein n=1 Tax=Iris pallida TaxID=29817 RepID=A0AAX6ID34_IRIPA|nr:hypothetical protein M6B38_261835 [Iris pallida]